MAKNENCNNKTFDKEKWTKIAPPEVATNPAGRQPTACMYHVSIDDVREFMESICTDYFGRDGFMSVDINGYVNKDEGVIEILVWFDWNSRHIVNTTLMSERDSIIQHPIQEKSGELKQFMQTFCTNNGAEQNRDTIYTETTPNRSDRACRCIKLDPIRVFNAMFDASGVYYGDTFNNGNRGKTCDIVVNPRWNSNNMKLKYFEVLKRVQMKRDHRPMSPRKGFHANR